MPPPTPITSDSSGLLMPQILVSLVMGSVGSLGARPAMVTWPETEPPAAGAAAAGGSSALAAAAAQSRAIESRRMLVPLSWAAGQAQARALPGRRLGSAGRRGSS